MTRAEKLANFDPNAPAVGNNQIYGLPFNYEESRVIILPVPWEVTASYGSGTSRGPEAIREASLQVDLFSETFPDSWQQGYFMLETSSQWKAMSDALRPKVIEYLRLLEKGAEPDLALQREVNEASDQLRKWVHQQVNNILAAGKIPAVVGGEHSVPLGSLQALAGTHDNFGILQIDAHADLRERYTGFEQSHASIMFNALKSNNINKLVQVGTRDYCDEEARRIDQDDRIVAFTEKRLMDRQLKGESWADCCESIVSQLPEKVYLSIDIDGLDPSLCPHTGTPVPGGLSFAALNFLLEMLVNSGKAIVGFDLCEVGHSSRTDWDANVGARVLYGLCNATVSSTKPAQ